MPWLDAGDTEKFREHAQRNVDVLAARGRSRDDIVVPQPTCAYTMKDEVPDVPRHRRRAKVAEHTFDASEFLMNEHREEPLDTDFDGRRTSRSCGTPRATTARSRSARRARNSWQLTGAKVQMVERCSAIDGTWGLRAENIEMAKQIAKPLMERVRESEAELVAGDCQLANTAIQEDDRQAAGRTRCRSWRARTASRTTRR